MLSADGKGIGSWLEDLWRVDKIWNSTQKICGCLTLPSNKIDGQKH
jgi:hypothetical protein